MFRALNTNSLTTNRKIILAIGVLFLFVSFQSLHGSSPKKPELSPSPKPLSRTPLSSPPSPPPPIELCNTCPLNHTYPKNPKAAVAAMTEDMMWKQHPRFSFSKCLDWTRTFKWTQQANDYNFALSADRRFCNLEVSMTTDSLIVEIGGNRGDDMDCFMKRHNCRYIVFEPSSKLAQGLRLKYTNNPRVEVHALGLSNVDKNVSFDAGGGIDANMWNDKVTNGEITQMVNATKFFMNHPVLSKEDVDVFHINCEGCEFPVLEELLEGQFPIKWKILQFGSHNYKGQVDTYARYCRIQELLQYTHQRVWGYPGAWERWVRKDIPSGVLNTIPY